MIRLLLNHPQYKTFREYGIPQKMPFSLTLNVTNRCNCQCKTCNIYKNPKKELTLEEIRKIFTNFDSRIHWLTFSGGEPFLRDDFDEICIEACKVLKPKVINIPTNGAFPDIVFQKMKVILAKCFKTKFIVNLSLDGFGKNHDEIRGVEGSFENTVETYSRLRKLKMKNLTLGIHTVLSKYNGVNFPDFYRKIIELEPDSYIVEYAQKRAELNNLYEDFSLDFKDYDKCVKELKSIPMQGRVKNKGMSKIIKILRSHYYDLTKAILLKHKQVLPCFAGVSSAHILSDGEVWACSVNAYSMGNLRKENYMFKNVWFGEKAQEIRRHIKKRICFCVDANINLQNMFFNYQCLLRFSLSFIRKVLS